MKKHSGMRPQDIVILLKVATYGNAGALVRGIKTSHSAPPLSDEILSDEIYVWPYVEGDTRGFAIEPLHPNVPKACIKDSKLYEHLALIDAIRIGSKREYNLAINELKRRFE